MKTLNHWYEPCYLYYDIFLCLGFPMPLLWNPILFFEPFLLWTFAILTLWFWTFWFGPFDMTIWYGLLIWSDYDDLWSVSFYDILLTYSVWPILVWHPSQIYFTRHGGSMSVSGMHPWHDSRAVEWCSAASPYLLSFMSSIICLLWPILFLVGRMDAS